ncbi:23S rRNA (guanosine(2251)-2'-O)-methyltransferase RlmB [Demequina zhanjiangensis]|uniref:23S rRNA (Guanosine(2251)-2'-O)-methyltransferase RlmB n=1 Tax=Demequina zhanjiangensis TaxID=3051659 RepID=A0ABT8FYS0_9MICO|nr:23S rRNA (guanosine(2251)-2'-O)-methyltransferase RlmB [Demequina sp. SYSU T00b26]MDN4471963.1 23S rRNA (guanosine(2251)-2'-O)-methyltransferase RlmB [Demequina sp. SYSU T00b26]
MAGNSQRRGATRNPGSKKGASVGTGGHGRKALEGKGPTPKAEDRPYHKAHKAKQRAEREAAKRPAPRGKQTPRNRTSGSDELAIGRNSVLEALRMGIPANVLHVFNRIEADDRVTEIVGLAVEAGIEVREVTKAALDGLAGGSPHQGVALEVPPYEYADPRDLLEATAPVRIVVLDHIQDPRNLGAILRSAGAFGASGVVIPERRAAGVTVAAWKVSAGAAARVPVARATNIARTLEDYKKAGVFAIGLDAGGEVDLHESNLLDGPLAIVVGSEGDGLSRLVSETCDQIVSIPIAATTESLNASVATSIALYEAKRAVS